MDSQVKLHQLAIEAVNSGQYRRAERLCAQLLEKDRKFADAWFLRAMCFVGLSRIQTALANLIEALKISPQNPEYLAHYAKLCLLINEPKRALIAADRAMQSSRLEPLTLDTLGVVFTKLAEYHKAYFALGKAVENSPKNSQFHFNLASAAQFLGKRDQAEKHYKKAIELRENFARAHWALSELNKNNEPDPDHASRLRTLILTPSKTHEDDLYLCHALAREEEKVGNYESAFNLLEQGKSRFRSTLNYSWEDDARLFSSIKESFAKTQMSSVPKEQGQEAVFILGMPRSGTTLVERILSTHSQVESLGELQNFALEVKKATGSATSAVLDLAICEQIPNIKLHELGEAYLGSLSNRKVDVAKFIDKTPLNFLHIGLIAKSLPGAKIILVRRNAMDTCLSNFRQLFAVSFSYYNYHYDLINTGHYYRLFDDLMNYWLALYKKQIMVLEYESLLQDTELYAKQLVEFCDLDWEPECLRFHENKNAVATASTMQVRQPIYKSAVGRWSHYDEQLAPLKKIFDEAGIGY